MKKHVIIFAFLCVSVFASAQLNTLYEKYSTGIGGFLSNITHSLAYGRHFAISASEYCINITELTNYYAPPTTGPYTTTTTLKIEPGYIISDISSLGGLVFVCGKKYVSNNPVQTIGFIGWFDLYDFATIPIPLTLNINYTDVNAVSRIDRIITYTAPNPMGGIKVVAISEKDYPNPGDATRLFQIIESNYDSYGGTLANVRIGELWNDYPNSNNLEVAYELVKSTDFIAIVGYNTLYNALSIRRCNPSNVLGNISWPFYYPSATHPVLSRTHSTATHATDNNLYISYLTNSNNSYFATCIREIKMSTMDMIGSQEMPLSDKSEPVGFEYPDSVHAPILAHNLLNQDSTTYSTNFIKLFPHCTADYVAKTVYKNSVKFQTSCINYLLIEDIIAASEGLEFFAHNMAYWNPASTQGCPNYDKVSIKYVRPVQRFSFQHTPNINTITLYKTVIPTVYHTFQPNNTCESH